MWSWIPRGISQWTSSSPHPNSFFQNQKSSVSGPKDSSIYDINLKRLLGEKIHMALRSSSKKDLQNCLVLTLVLCGTNMHQLAVWNGDSWGSRNQVGWIGEFVWCSWRASLCMATTIASLPPHLVAVIICLIPTWMNQKSSYFPPTAKRNKNATFCDRLPVHTQHLSFRFHSYKRCEEVKKGYSEVHSVFIKGAN